MCEIIYMELQFIIYCRSQQLLLNIQTYVAKHTVIASFSWWEFLSFFPETEMEWSKGDG